MAKTKILFVADEMQPYLKISEMANLARMLPQHMQEKGMEIRVLMPRFGCINERRHRLHEVVRLSGINVTIGDDDNPLIIKVASLPTAKMQVYFLDNEEYFHRKYAARDAKNAFFEDNHERMIFFSKGVMETVVKLGWAPSIIHCSGWMTSLIPVYLKKAYQSNPVFKDSKVIFTANENVFEESLSNDFMHKALMEDMSAEDLAPFQGLTNEALQIGAATYSDAIVKATNDLHPELEKMLLLNNDKPILDVCEEDLWQETYFDFYQKVLSSQSVLI